MEEKEVAEKGEIESLGRLRVNEQSNQGAACQTVVSIAVAPGAVVKTIIAETIRVDL